MLVRNVNDPRPDMENTSCRNIFAINYTARAIDMVEISAKRDTHMS